MYCWQRQHCRHCRPRHRSYPGSGRRLLRPGAPFCCSYRRRRLAQRAPVHRQLPAVAAYRRGRAGGEQVDGSNQPAGPQCDFRTQNGPILSLEGNGRSLGGLYGAKHVLSECLAPDTLSECRLVRRCWGTALSELRNGHGALPPSSPRWSSATITAAAVAETLCGERERGRYMHDE